MTEPRKPFAMQVGYDQPELLGARWWYEGLSPAPGSSPRTTKPATADESRRTALKVLVGVAGGLLVTSVVVGMLSGDDDSPPDIDGASLDLQRANGLDYLANGATFQWPDAAATSPDPLESIEGIREALRDLLDRRAIWECLLRYARGVDRFDAELIRSAFHDDALDDHGKFVGDAAEFVEWAVGQHTHAHLGHLHNLFNHTCELDGDVVAAAARLGDDLVASGRIPSASTLAIVSVTPELTAGPSNVLRLQRTSI